MRVVLYKRAQFERSLERMKRAGGTARLAEKQVWEILGKARQGDANAMGNLTHHGETRIPNCVKYDLAGQHRLVTVRYDATIFFLTAGSHADCDRWIEGHRGHRFVIDRSTKALSVIEDVHERANRVEAMRAQAPRPLQAVAEHRVPVDVAHPIADRFRLPEAQTNWLKHSWPTASDEAFLDFLEHGIDPSTAASLLDIHLDLRAGNPASALARAALHSGAAALADREPRLLDESIEVPINSDEIVDISDLTDDEFQRLAESESLEDWLLYLHRNQVRVARESYPNPLVLNGVSGSGKTVVLIRRAMHLASTYRTGQIALFVLNDALADLIAHLLTRACPPAQRERIEVISIRPFLYGRSNATGELGTPEALEEVWQDCFERSAKQLEPIVRALQARGLDAARYIRDEFRWVLSGFTQYTDDRGTLPSRADYRFGIERTGRAIPFTEDWRTRTVVALEMYEDTLARRGLVDPDALGVLALGAVSRTYRAVLVDEYQDLGTTELKAVLLATGSAPDAVSLAGDGRQKVFPKRINLREAGIPNPVRRRFQKNYRNTREILDAAWTVLQTARDEEQLEADDALSPELSARRGALPEIVQVANPEAEISLVAEVIKRYRHTRADPVCVALCGVRDDEQELLQATADAYRRFGLDARLLAGAAKPIQGVTNIAPLETVKGFEFPLVIVTQCGSGYMPAPQLPAEEAWRDARRLYVAMTRARDRLLITHTGAPSPFLVSAAEKFRFLSPGDLVGLGVEEEATGSPESGPPLAEVPPAPQAAPPPVPPQADVPTKPVIQALHDLGFRCVDKRQVGGALWVIGGEDLSAAMQRLNAAGFSFTFCPTGGRTTSHRPSWWTKRAPDLLAPRAEYSAQSS